MEDSREGEGDDEKKDVECQVHTWMMKKGKKAMVYKARKDRRKGDRKKEKEKGKSDLEGMSEEDLLLHTILVS